jgi:hypothetical protein
LLCQFCLLAALGTLYAAAGYSGRGIEEEAAEVIRRGDAANEGGWPEVAFGEWEYVIDRYPHTSACGLALLKTGLWQQQRGGYQAAIAQFERLLDSGGKYQGYRHFACQMMSSCYEALGDYPSALHFAVLGRDAHPFQSDCGTCVESVSKALNERIERLEKRVRGAG